MTWNQGLQDVSIFQQLSTITARLLRITTYEQLLRGESQVRSIGANVDITSEYRKFAREEALKLGEVTKRAKPVKLLRIIPDKGNTF